MDIPKYSYKTNESFLSYEFVSEGPKGKIKKAVHFIKINAAVYNLGFGDVDEQTNRVNDLVATNNKDTRKVLATVASTVYDFFRHYPDVYVFIQGSTPARTRLYKIGIVNNWHEISASFDVYGFKDGEWETFQLQDVYEAFLVTRKNT
jgi:hypothetical protein